MSGKIQGDEMERRPATNAAAIVTSIAVYATTAPRPQRAASGAEPGATTQYCVGDNR